MISVQNHRLQSNGNKRRSFAFIAIILLPVFFWACHSVTYPIQGEKPTKPKSPPAAGLPKVDTVQWVEKKMETQKPTTTSPLVRQISKKSPTDLVYRVAILIPLNTGHLDEADDEMLNNNQRAIQFYAGAKIALDSLRNSGIKMKVDVYDTQESAAALSKILEKPGMKNLDMIIGPYISENVQQVGQFAKENRIVLFSPWNTSLDLFEDNPYFVQLKPGLKTHCETICKDIVSKYKASQVTILIKNPQKDKLRLDYFREYFKAMYGAKEAAKIREIYVGETGESIKTSGIAESLTRSETEVVIVPHWSTETYVIYLLRAINGARKQNPTVVYGFPQWKNFKSIDQDLFNRLQVQITSSSKLSDNPETMLAFRRAFYQKYSALPSDESIYGFDVMRYCMEIIRRHKFKFPEHLDYKSVETLDFIFGPVPVVHGDAKKNISTAYYENKNLNWLLFQKNNFVIRDTIN